MKLWDKIYIDGTGYRQGDHITIEGEGLHVLDAGWRHVMVTRHRHIGSFFYRIGQSLRYTERYLVVLLSVWGLAEWEPVAIPTWRDVHLLRRLAGKLSRHNLGKEGTG